MVKTHKRIKSKNSINQTAVAISVVTLIVAAAFLTPAVKAKDNPDDYTRVYSHTFDEVFQAAQKAVERQGYFVTDSNKEKGVITGKGDMPIPTAGVTRHFEFTLRLETTAAEQTRATIDVVFKGNCLDTLPPSSKKWRQTFLQNYKRC